MPRIAGVDIPGKKRVESSLTYIYGIGWSRSHQILTEAGIDFATRTENLTEDQIARIRTVLESKQKVEGELKRDVQQNINRLKELGCYRGLRHRKGLPARGQRTKTNARTRKGPRRQPVAGKKAPGKK